MSYWNPELVANGSVKDNMFIEGTINGETENYKKIWIDFKNEIGRGSMQYQDFLIEGTFKSFNVYSSNFLIKEGKFTMTNHDSWTEYYYKQNKRHGKYKSESQGRIEYGVFENDIFKSKISEKEYNTY